MSATAPADLRHLVHLMGEHGLYEHADGTEPRREHGYCTDDNARLLLVATREGDRGDSAVLSRRALAFVLSALDERGRMHNRMDDHGQWTDEPTTDDCWGRGVWALGVTAAEHVDPAVRDAAAAGFLRAAANSAPSPRSMAFAALGAAEIMAIDPRNRTARTMLLRTLATIRPIPSGDWCWPEPRLAYANATMAEALIAAGTAVNSASDVRRGLSMLAWLLALETRSGHLSTTPVGGRGPTDVGPMFDQQPIEAAAMADACSRALTVTGDASWAQGITAAARWFEGDNDSGLPMRDPQSGGGYDGLHRDAVNLNQGAESTLALVSTFQQSRQLTVKS